jgi:hypothetical protein
MILSADLMEHASTLREVSNVTALSDLPVLMTEKHAKMLMNAHMRQIVSMVDVTTSPVDSTATAYQDTKKMRKDLNAKILTSVKRFLTVSMVNASTKAVHTCVNVLKDSATTHLESAA